MACPGPDRVLEYLAHALDEDREAAFETHIDDCAACRELLVELARSPEVTALVPSREPTRIARYQVEHRLGEGGMGVVYAAFDPQLERRVAIKVVHAEVAAESGLDRLLHEGRALARLSHPNVIGVHDVGEADHSIYLAMELVEGESLAAWLATPRPWRAIVTAFLDVARGLAAAHRVGVIHRDVKPANAIVSRDGIVKVVDFGLAGLESSRRRRRLTAPGTVLGTRGLMSPEQQRGDDVGPATDQFSLCAALRDALDGAPGVPRRIRAAIARGTEPEVAARFASMDDLIAALAPRHVRWRWTVAGAVVVAVAAAIVLGAGHGADPIGEGCALAAAERAALWTAEDRDAVGRALAATGAPDAAETARRIDVELGRYLAHMAAGETTLCDQRPQQADARTAIEQGLACLATRRAAVARLVTQLRGGGLAEARKGAAAVRELVVVNECTNPLVLASRGVTADVQLVVERALLAGEIYAARKTHAAGNYVAAAAHGRAAVALARPRGGIYLAGALVDLAYEVTLTEGPHAAAEAQREAAAIAEQVHADEVRMIATLDLMTSLAQVTGREREALGMRSLVEAAAARIDPRGYEHVIRSTASKALLRLGRADTAVVEAEHGLRLARAIAPPRDPALCDYIATAADALLATGRDAAAQALHAEAVAIAGEEWGRAHPEAAQFAARAAIARATTGDCAGARDELAAAHAVLARALPATNELRVALVRWIARCDRATAASSLHALQAALTAAGRSAAPQLAETWVDVGDAARARGDAPAAIAAYRRGLTEVERVVGPIDARLAPPLVALGELEASAAPLERALAILDEAGVPPLARAPAQLALARALATREPARARTLADAARAGFATGGPRFAAQARQAVLAP
jgi:eukaryotic-like serine/threonine-protein kinase